VTDPGYFEDLYRTDPDPWRLEGSAYEDRKRALTLASLPRARYRRAFEPACAGGRITELLAARCEAVLAMDPVEVAIERVRARALSGVEPVQGAVPEDWPGGTFDLVVLSELLYFLTRAQRRLVADLTLASLAPRGHVVAVHWRHDFEEAASEPESAHSELHTTGLRTLVTHLEDDFRLEVLGRA
jgi:SAM-dependent methyltransferase